MFCNNKINPAELAVVGSLLVTIGSFLLLLVALDVLSEENAAQNINKSETIKQIQNLNEQLLLLQRKL